MPVLATRQAVLVGIAAPCLLVRSRNSTSSDVAYTDGNSTGTAEKYFSLLD